MEERTEKFLQDIGVGLRTINDPFFEDSYRACKIFQRKGVTVEDDEELCHEIIKEFRCYASGCKASFHTLLDFEMHYNTNHQYVCAECKKSLPNPRLLDIHIQETHDSFFKVLSAKQPMYQCYVSECDVKFNDPLERRNHCISVHKFAKNFRFDNSHSGKVAPKDKMDIDESEAERKDQKNKKILLNKNQKNKMFTAATKSIVSTNFNSKESQPISSKPSSTTSASLVFVPRQVQKSYTKALTKNQSSERNVLETETMMDLAESLPE